MSWTPLRLACVSLAIIVCLAFDFSAFDANAASVTVHIKSGMVAGDSLVAGGGVMSECAIPIAAAELDLAIERISSESDI